MSIRLDKYLSDSDKMLSRREAAAVIRRGSVALDGVTVKDPSRHVNEGVTVTLDGDRVTYQEFIYLMMNKPAGCVTAMSDRRGGERLVTEFLPAELLRRDISPVGRLDRDTTGLLIFTDDGMSAHRALSPKTHVTKT
ncbi:MAG: pseudouridine synthase, partial [Firmicutes bacterium]|nr:pseudouridine synthase [Bacillota bacterium]